MELANNISVFAASTNVPQRDSSTLAPVVLALAQYLLLMTDQIMDLQTQLKAAADRSDLDSLTGLCNQRRFREQLDSELSRAQRYNHPLALLFIDIDDFKKINDQFGHSAGNTVLERVADILKPHAHGLRQTDFAARFGGDEFCVLLPETGLQGALTKAGRIRRTIQHMDWSVNHLDITPVTVSIGVAAFPHNAVRSTQILNYADAALYDAKRGGKNLVVPAPLQCSEYSWARNTCRGVRNHVLHGRRSPHCENATPGTDTRKA